MKQTEAFPARSKPAPRLRWLALVLLLQAGVALAQAAAPGLSVDAEGQFLLHGRPYRGLGVNYYDAFVRTLGPTNTTSYEDGFKELAARRIPFARFSAGGYWPREWDLHRTNRAEYFRRLDGVVHSAERHGIGLIPSLFWHLSTVPDLVGESCRAWGDPDSRTIAFMRDYTREVVTRYTNSPALWGWEFGNEYNLPADLPNAADHRPPVVPRLGTATSRTAADEITHDNFRVALREFAREVRRHDPHRALFSGNAFPRPSAWHQARERSWKKDSPDQFAAVLAADHPAPVNTLSGRGYALATDFARLPQALAVARTERKPLFLGEFGVPGPVTPESRQAFTRQLEILETNHVSLAALWVFDFPGQARDWSVSATNDRRWQLEALQAANARLQSHTD